MINLGWSKPTSGYVKCNYDSHYHGEERSIGAWIFRDENGFFMEAGRSMGGVVFSVLEAKLQALLMAIHQAWIRGYRDVIFEGDNKKVH